MIDGLGEEFLVAFSCLKVVCNIHHARLDYYSELPRAFGMEAPAQQ
jgi:hypothetical protein